MISIHTPVKGVTSPHDRQDAERDISIHTPVKGVTFPFCAESAADDISIHTPVKGVTLRIGGLSHLHEVFQSTHP